MPIVAVDIVDAGDDGPPGIAAALADRIAAALGASPGTVWLRVQRVAKPDYAENGPVPEPPPIFVHVLAREDDRASRAERALAIASAVASVVGRPRERVHVIYEPDARGRVFFAGIPGPD